MSLGEGLQPEDTLYQANELIRAARERSEAAKAAFVDSARDNGSVPVPLEITRELIVSGIDAAASHRRAATQAADRILGYEVETTVDDVTSEAA